MKRTMSVYSHSVVQVTKKTQASAMPTLQTSSSPKGLTGAYALASLYLSRAPHTTQEFLCADFAVTSFRQHSRQPAPTLKRKEKSFDESGPEDIHVSEEEEDERPDDERPEDDYAPLSLPTPMFPTPPVMVHHATTYTCDP